jgi:hypothetical protein
MRKMTIVLLCLLTCRVACGQGRSVAPVSDEVRTYARKAMKELKAEHASMLKTCKGGDLSSIYFSSYVLDGALAGAECTGDEEFLKIAIESIDAIIASGKDQNGDGYLDFYHSVDKDGANQGWDFNHQSISHSTLFKGLRPISRAARVILQRFASNPAHREKAGDYLAFVCKHIVEKWTNKGLLPNTDNISLCDMMVDMYVATGKEEYRRIAERQARHWKDQMRLVQSGYVWNVGETVADCSHANSYVGYAALACRAGLVFTEEDMLRYCVTLKRLWRGPDKPLADFVDNTESPPGGKKWGGFLADGWVKLGMFSPEMQTMLAGRTKLGSNRTEYWGNMALNAAYGPNKAWKLTPSKNELAQPAAGLHLPEDGQKSQR